MDGGLLAAPHAGAISPEIREVVSPLEEQRGENADPLLEVGDIDVAVVGLGELLPQAPVAP